jgi:hypothetical protein
MQVFFFHSRWTGGFVAFLWRSFVKLLKEVQYEDISIYTSDIDLDVISM